MALHQVWWKRGCVGASRSGWIWSGDDAQQGIGAMEVECTRPTGYLGGS